MITVEVSWYTEFFQSVKLYCGHGDTGEQDCMLTVDSYPGVEMYVFEP